MKHKLGIRSVVRCIALTLAALVSLLAVVGWLHLNHKELTARRRIAEVEEYAMPVEALPIPETAQIVGLGEASHGNAEFQELKLSVFQRLVKEYGFRAFALELDFGEGLMVNDYIQGGEGTAEEIAARLSFPIYHTEQIAALIEWMRTYNAAAEAEDKVRFYGFDMQNTMESARRVIAVCQEQGISGIEAELADLSDLREPDTALNAERAMQIKQALSHISDAIIQKQTGSLWQESISEALQAIRTLSQAMGTYEIDAAGYNDYRDGCMADNAAWIVQHEEAAGHGKVMIAAHNGHIARSGEHTSPMGSLLSERFGNRYYAMGTGFFTADINISTSPVMTDTPKRGIHHFCSADPLAYQARFMPEKRYALDLSAIPAANEALYRMIRQPMPMASVGEGYMWIWYFFPQLTYRPEQTPSELFDAMIYVDHAKPTEVK